MVGGILDVKMFPLHASTIGWWNGQDEQLLKRWVHHPLLEFGSWWIGSTAQWRETQPPVEKEAEWRFYRVVALAVCRVDAKRISCDVSSRDSVVRFFGLWDVL